MEHGTTERSWTIRPLTEADIEAYLDIYLNSYPAYKSLDEECRQHYRDKRHAAGHYEADPVLHELLRQNAACLRPDGAGGAPVT